MQSSSIEVKLWHVSGAGLNRYHSPMNLRGPTAGLDPRRAGGAAAAVLLALFTLAPTCGASTVASGFGRAGARPAAQTSDALRLQGLELAYNLDHDRSLDLLRRAVSLAPDDPAAHRSLASVLLLNMLFRRGAVTVDHYLGSFSRSSVDLPKPPPEADAEFRRHVARASTLAEARVAARPDDAQAHYDLGAALGLRASYVATVEGKLLAGFKAARRSFDEHERVLELDPARKDAGLIVGTYRYVVSTLSLPMRVMAYVVGFGGGRERAILLLEEAARYRGPAGRAASASAVTSDAATDAMFALILVYNRERRHDDALRVLEELRRLYPRNRLLLLEAGATALRGGKARQADELLSEGLRRLAGDRRDRIPGEEALWRYKRGAARAALGRTDEALEDLRAATSAGAQAWVNGRARVELGRLALQRGDRATAAREAAEARALCERGSDPACVRDARALSRSSHGR
jgi:tetratricopeptide (TPR) repeat protein